MTKQRTALRQTALQKDSDAFEEALDECFRSDQLQGICDVLVEVLPEEWHFRHEDVVKAIQELRCDNAVLALERRALNCPQYLVWDENFALARKCIWALADIGTEEAKKALMRLSRCGIAVVEGFAQKRLDQWSSELA
jgi:hypothetical protein